MRLAYISPSSLPSRSANSVHVALQCEALARSGAEVTLYAKRTVPAAAQLAPAVREAYGVDATGMRLVTYFSPFDRADVLRIALLACHDLLRHRPAAILSRNLYASYALAVLSRRPLLFETHQLETGVRRRLQRAIMTCPWVTTIAVSGRLVECLAEHHGIGPRRSLVLHDAAPEGIVPVPRAQRRTQLRAIVPEAAAGWDAACGYFGHLYPGRGIEVIEAMAELRPRCLFLVFGGTERDLAVRRERSSRPNLRYLGHIPHPTARRLMVLFDVLLMPYQESVSIGVAGHDTGRWMSPMKMFEYLASGVPIISSDLPALREVLRAGENGLVVPPTDVAAWVAALDRIITDEQLAQALSTNAHREYLESHTWTRRAEKLLAAARSL